MLSAFAALKNLIKTRYYHIDRPLFRLHHRATVCLLLVFCIILSTKMYFGDPIDCRQTDLHNENFFDNVCYATGTFIRFKPDPKTVDARYPQKLLANFRVRANSNFSHLYPGIPLQVDNYNPKNTEDIILPQSYYQYMPFVLFLQAAFFYFPHYLWKIWENGTISDICKRLHDNRMAPSAYLESDHNFIYYLQNCFRLNKSLVFKYHFCHVLLLFNLVIQVMVLDRIFNYNFILYGYSVFNYLFIDNEWFNMTRMSGKRGHVELNNPINVIFPKMSICVVETSSSVGKDLNTKEFLCVLPMNILNDKFFLLLWFWFVILGSLTIIQIISDLLYTILPFFRKYLFNKRHGSHLWETDPGRPVPLSEIFILDLVGCNSDKMAFLTLLRKLHKEDDWTASPSENHSMV